MALFTSILNLFKKDPATDGTTTFNIQTMLNDNWDKIDAEIGTIRAKIRTAVADLAALKAINTTADATPDKSIILVKSLGIYMFDSTSVTAGNDNTVVAPTTGTGRWIKVASVVMPAGTVVGTSDTQTLTNKTLTSPRVGTAILDTNGNEVLIVTPTASAVNELTLANAATGGKPTLTASGGDANISINIVPKGTGTVQVNGNTVLHTGVQNYTPMATASAATAATAGWYRIAQSAVNIGSNSALFKIDFSGTGVKGRVLLAASCQDGVDTATAINQLAFTSSNYTLGLTKVRIVYHTTATANYAYVEVYNPTALAITYVVDIIDSTGWSIVTPNTAGSIPTGYTNKELTLDPGLITLEDITTAKQIKSTVAAGTAPLVVASNTMVNNLNAELHNGKSAPSGNIVGDTDTQTLTNKTLTSPKVGTAILDTNGNEVVNVSPTTNAVNELTIANAATGGKPTISATGGDTNITLNLVPKGSGTVQANGVDVVTTTGTQSLTNKTLTSPKVGTAITDTNGNEIIAISPTASAVNELTVANAAAGGNPSISATGSDTNISINLVPKGTGTVKVKGTDLVAIDDFVRNPPFAATTGTANTYVLSTTPNPSSLVDGIGVFVKINADNTGAATLNWNSLGAKAIVDYKGAALTAGKLKAGIIYHLRYNAGLTSFQLQGEGGEYGTAAPAQVLEGYTVGTATGVVPGTMLNRPYDTVSTNISPGGGNGSLWIGIPTGAYLTEGGWGAGYANVTINDPNFINVNIPSDKSMFGLQGTMPIPAAGNAIVYNPNTGNNGTNTSYVKVADVKVKMRGTYRVKFDLGVDSGATVYGRIYKNGVAYGTERTATYSYVTFTEDLYFNAGDNVQLYVRNTLGGSVSHYWRYFMLLSDIFTTVL